MWTRRHASYFDALLVVRELVKSFALRNGSLACAAATASAPLLGFGWLASKEALTDVLSAKFELDLLAFDSLGLGLRSASIFLLVVLASGALAVFLTGDGCEYDKKNDAC